MATNHICITTLSRSAIFLWNAFWEESRSLAGVPIAISCHDSRVSNDFFAVLKHSDRVCVVDLEIVGSRQWEQVVPAIQEPLPVLTHLKLSGYVDVPVPASGFLDGSVPCLQNLHLQGIPFPELPVSFLIGLWPRFSPTQLYTPD